MDITGNMDEIRSEEINAKQHSMDMYSRFYETGSDSGIEDPSLQGEERDTIPRTIIRTTSPKHRERGLSSWDTRFPKRLYDSSTYCFGRSRDRRMSDPGHLSVSPVRSRARVRHGLSELSLEEECEDGSVDHPRLSELRSHSLSVDDCYVTPRSLSPSRSRSRERYLWKRKAQRSYSLPNSDPGVFEIGEAIGALAVSGDSMDLCGRRRSISMEPSYLEAIAEEGAGFRGSLKLGRRHSTSHISN